jgi:Na+/H+ antiporter NhaD/arsenite permease-like protein
MMILTLLLINIFVVLAHESGFFEYMDDWVSKKWKFHHLPKIVMCACARHGG